MKNDQILLHVPNPEFIAHNSRFFENLMEHRFLFDLARDLVLRDPPRLMNILKAEVDMFGFDLVLSVANIVRNVQVKARSGKPANTPYDIAETIWNTSGGCVVWILYSAIELEPASYFMLSDPLPLLDRFRVSERGGFPKVKMQQANHRRFSISGLADRLFGVSPSNPPTSGPQ